MFFCAWKLRRPAEPLSRVICGASGEDRLPQRGPRKTTVYRGPFCLFRFFGSEAGHHLENRDARIAQLEVRVAEQDQQAGQAAQAYIGSKNRHQRVEQVVDFGRQLLAREVRCWAQEWLTDSRAAVCHGSVCNRLHLWGAKVAPRNSRAGEALGEAGARTYAEPRQSR